MSDYRQRSRSPHHSSQVDSHRDRTHRNQSRSHSPHHKKRKHSSHQYPTPVKPLPYNAVQLSKSDLPKYRPLFTLYLDIQKHLDIDDLLEDEVKGRWKSFMKKWNAGDLANGWYDPKTYEKAIRATFGTKEHDYNGQSNKASAKPAKRKARDSDDEEFGPSPPASPPNPSSSLANSTRLGPVIPSTDDIRARDEQSRDDAADARDVHRNEIKAERKAERKVQKDRLEELVPRAEPGSRERQLEKKREMALSNRAFAAAKDAGGDVELRDADVMGEEDSLAELKRMKEMDQRKKTEREVRREEILRARTAEREERMKGLREKEAKTMEMLKSIARARFGGGSTP